MRFKKFIPPISIVLFLVFTFAGTYYVRLRILEKHMVAAMEMDDRDSIQRLAASWPSPARAKDEHGRTPLHWAAEHNDAALTRALLDRGAQVNAFAKRDEQRKTDLEFFGGTTPLHRALILDQWDVAWVLVERGAEVNVLTQGCGDGFDSYAPVELAAPDASPEFVDFLIRSGAAVKDCGNQFHCPLTEAFNNTGVMRVLLDHGADIQWAGVDGYTVLHMAVFDNQPAAAKFLLQRGAKVDSRDLGGGTPLHLAAHYGYVECAEALLAHGTNVDARDADGKTPLTISEEPAADAWAPVEKRKPVANLLHRHGAKE